VVGDVGIVAASEEHPLTRNLHAAFGVENRDAVDAWWNRLTDGHNVEAVFHDRS
jgi:hypothetical protein